MTDLKIAVIVGSTRPGRVGKQVGDWVLAQAKNRGDAQYELVDLADFPLPHLDEAIPASMGQYQNAHTKNWAETIAKYDGYVFVTPEYNHSTSGALKNAIDFVYGEWNNKAAGIVSYGSAGGARAAEHLRLIFGELQIADVRQQVMFSLATEFENWSVMKTPSEYQANALSTQLDQLVSWSTALRAVRTGQLQESLAA